MKKFITAVLFALCALTVSAAPPTQQNVATKNSINIFTAPNTFRSLVTFSSGLTTTTVNSLTMTGQPTAPLALVTQAASIGTTNLLASAPAGQYRACWVQTITRAATSTSSLLTTIGWNNGAAKTTTLASLNGGALQTTADATNVLNSTMSNCATFSVAASTNITYATTYASSGATTMQYSLDVSLERLR